MQEMIRIALVLYLAHLLTDFLFQTSRMVGLKRAGKFKGYVEHGAVHYVAALVAGGFFLPGMFWSFRFQLVVALLTVVHVGIDWCKTSLGKRYAVADGTWGFTVDQVVHAVTVFLAAWWIAGGPAAAEMVRVLGILRRPDNRILLVMVVYVAVIFGAGYLIRSLTRPLMKDLKVNESHAQLSNAGMFIGWLERFLILSALVEHSPATAGLILAAKSIARYPEFKREQFAEYFLIGTLLSISAAIIGGVILVKVVHGGMGLP
jgi:Protein of unknown function (DUF3307)